MTDEIADDSEFEIIEPIEKERSRGSVMRELESWERIIEGLKMASEGAREMARWAFPDKWNQFAMYLDSVRKAVIRDGGFDRPADAKESEQKFGGDRMPMVQACSRVFNGLKMAAAGADQIANCQRLDIRWVTYALRFRELADIQRKLSIETTARITDQGWRNKVSGLIVPSRLH